jgi:hypothetical protein
MYRMQKYDSRATGMHWQLHKAGAEHSRVARVPFPVAVCLGGDPVLTYAPSDAPSSVAAARCRAVEAGPLRVPSTFATAPCRGGDS